MSFYHTRRWKEPWYSAISRFVHSCGPYVKEHSHLTFVEDVRSLLKWNNRKWRGPPPSMWAIRVAIADRLLEVLNPRNTRDWDSEGEPLKSKEDAKWSDWKYDPAMISSEEEMQKVCQDYGDNREIRRLVQAIHYSQQDSTKEVWVDDVEGYMEMNLFFDSPRRVSGGVCWDRSLYFGPSFGSELRLRIPLGRRLCALRASWKRCSICDLLWANPACNDEMWRRHGEVPWHT